MIAIPTKAAADRRLKVQRCPACLSWRTKSHGLCRGVRRRYQCRECCKTWGDPPCHPFHPMRIPVAKATAFLQHIELGSGVRASSRAAQIHMNTGMALLRRTGTVRLCRTCGGNLSGNQSRYCSAGCREWRRRAYYRPKPPVIPLFSDTANVLRSMENEHHDPHTTLAWEIAQEFSELKAAEFWGPCYEGVIEACQAGVEDAAGCREFAQKAIKRMWKETKTWGRTLGELQESIGWEPTAIGATP